MEPELRLSATQIADGRLCERKWGWSKLDGIKKAPHPSAELGTRVHDVLEKWLKHGQAIDTATIEGKIAASGIQHLPAPSPDLEVEEWIELRTDVAVYIGKVDLAYRNPHTGRIVTHDHKSTSDLGWAKEEDDLWPAEGNPEGKLKDPQAVIYAAEAMARHGVDEVELSWLYMTTKGKNKSKRTHLTVLRSEVEQGLKEVDATAAWMLAAHAQGLKALDLKPNVKACDAYGGCAYADNCNLSTVDRMKALMAQETLLEKIKRERAEKAAAAGGAPATPSAPAAAAPAPATPAAPRKPGPVVNPPEAPKTPAPASAPAAQHHVPALDLSPLVAALKDVAAKHAPRDLRDEIVLAILSSGNVDLFEGAYELADTVLKGRK